MDSFVLGLQTDSNTQALHCFATKHARSRQVPVQDICPLAADSPCAVGTLAKPRICRAAGELACLSCCAKGLARLLNDIARSV